MATGSTYVKFQRGSQAAYENLKKKSNDTLYFVSTDSNKLDLYLGSEKVSGEASSGVSSISQLSDVQISQVIPNSVLLYRNDKWQNTPLENLSSILQIPKEMVGATKDSNGKSGTVIAPKTYEVNNFLRGDGTWSSIEPIAQNIVDTSISRIINSAPETLDTLGEIADWINNNQSQTTSLISQIATVSNDIQKINKSVLSLQKKDEDLEGRIVNGQIPALSNYVTTINFQSTIGSISQLGQIYNPDQNNIINEINRINETLNWKKLK